MVDRRGRRTVGGPQPLGSALTAVRTEGAAVLRVIDAGRLD